MAGKSSQVCRRVGVKAPKGQATRAATAGDIADEGGKPAGSQSADIVQRARRHTDAALEAFVSVMQDAGAPAAARVAAATQILNWGHGKGVGADSDDAPKTVRLAWEG